MVKKSSHKHKNPFSRLNICADTDCTGMTRRYALVFSLTFLIVAALTYFPFLLWRRSFIWEVDGLSQHYTALMYIGQYFREVLHNIFVEGSFSMPMWDFSIGAGSDVLTTFNYYGMGDPLCLLSVFVPEKYTVHLYNFLILLRLYLSGLFFSLFCFRKKQRHLETMLGALTYMFCGYALYAGCRHPFFLMPMMFFPLLLLGVEKILDRESPVLFILSVFGALITNFYFSYMLIILTVIYVAVRYFTDKERKDKFLVLLGKFFGFGVIGVLMACVILVPVLIVFLGNSRSGVDRGGFSLINDTMYYSMFISKFMSYSVPGMWTVTGFAPLSLIGVVVLFRKKGEYRWLKLLFIIFTVMLLLPVFSKIMNGFAYESNRWIWGYAFILSFILVVMFRPLLSLKRKEKLTLVGFAAAYYILCFLLTQKFNVSMVAQYVIFAILIMLFVCAKDFSSKKGKKILKASVALLSIVSIVMNGAYCYSTEYSDYLQEFVEIEDAYALIDKSVSKQMKEEMDEEFCRYEQIDNYVRNGAIADDTNGVSFYWSLCDNYIGDFLKDNGAVRYTSYNYQHLYKFTSLDSLFSVKYFFTMKPEANVPYGYEFLKEVKTAEGTYYVYENQYALPMGFTYSDYITREEYMTLSNAQRQEALLSNILLEEDIEGFNSGTYTLESYEIPFEIVSTDGATVKDNTIIALKDNAKINLSFDSVEDCELYLNFVGLECEEYYNNEEILKQEGKWNKLYFNQKLQIKKETAYERDVQEFTFRVKSLDYKPKFTLSSSDYQNYDGIHNFLTNLGYTDKARDTITVEISNPGKFTFDEMNLVVQPMDNYVRNVEERSKNTLGNIEILDNSFSGDITLEEPQLLFVSVPYSKGFKAFVDGEEVEILRGNTWGMALALDEGEHRIEFRYRTRGLIAGACFSLVGVVAFAMVVFLGSRKKKTLNSKK